MTIDANDPKLTAYVLGELDEPERAEIERELEQNEAASLEVAEIRAAAAQVTSALAAEPQLTLTADQREKVERGVPATPTIRSPWKLRRVWVGTALAAAACVAIAVIGPGNLFPGRVDETSLLAMGGGDKDGAVAGQRENYLLPYSREPVAPGSSVTGPTSPVMKSAGQLESEVPSFQDAPALNLDRAMTAAEAVQSNDRQFDFIAEAMLVPAIRDDLNGDGIVDGVELGRTEEGEVLGITGYSIATTAGQTPPTAPDSGGNYAVPGHAGQPLGGGAAAPGGGSGRGKKTDPGHRYRYNDVRIAPARPDASEEEVARYIARRAPDFGPNTENYAAIVDNAFLAARENPLSTFSIDVDTASYANTRRFLTQGQLPPPDAVRIEELLNYFRYDYAPPTADSPDPFAAHIELGPCPWQPGHRLVRIGLKGREVAMDQRPATNLVFLIDVSGSMQPENKLPLLKASMKMLVDQLHGDDRLAIVVYAGSTGLALPSTYCSEKATILSAIDQCQAGGSTAGAAGIQLAYDIAQQHFIKGGINRVVLATDGDFNVGVSDEGGLLRLIEEKRASGVSLSVLGFGEGNLQDAKMELLADKGNGNYAYIDSLREGRKVLVEEASGTLITIAKDVKIQVEFNPAEVGAYRLIGYENRVLAAQDFNDDRKDAGEIGAGHEVTALYEIVPAGKPMPGVAPPVDALKYQQPATSPAPAEEPAAVPSDAAFTGELLTLKLRYKQPDGDESKLIEFAVKDDEAVAGRPGSTDFQFASAVAAFGMILRDSPHKGSATLPLVLDLAQGGKGADAEGYRAEFIQLVQAARALRGQ